MFRPESICALAKGWNVAHDPLSECKVFDKERDLLSVDQTAYCICSIALEDMQCVRGLANLFLTT
jgi:hypothetical protein